MQENLSSLSKLQIESARYQSKEWYKAKARNDLLTFTKYTMPGFRINWHHVALADKIEKLISGEIKFLLVFAPPRHGKSELVSRRLPAYIHGKFPNDKIMAGSYSMSLAKDMTGDVQKIMDTEEYVELFPNSRVVAAGDRHPVAKRNTEEHDIVDKDGILTGGKYRGQGIGGSFTGKGANWIILDDPIKGREAADSEAFREKLWNFYVSDLRSRLQKGGRILITLTRWHEDDLAGRILAKMKTDPDFDKFELFSLPAIKEDDTNPADIRKIGDPLWPQEYDLQALRAIRAGGLRDFLALFQQRPAPTEGNIIKRHWWKYYKAIPSKFDKIIQSWDLTFKGKKNSDWVCGGVWGKIGADKYLLDVFREKIGFNDQIKAIVSMSAKWPDATAKYIEDAANGAALIETLQSKIPGLIAVPAKGSKEARAESISPQAEAGNIWLPDPEFLPVPWVHDYIEEWAAFPNGTHDDQVDMTSMAVSKLTDVVVEDWSIVSVTKRSTWNK
jgi:predicted phage terminase large subunit-like protein